MSDIRAIRNHLRAWPSINDPKRYYVNDWVERIQHELGVYLASHPRCPSFGLLRKVGKVWYDTDASVHVEGIYDWDLTRFIAKTMEDTQFIYYDPGDNLPSGEVIDWGQFTDSLPHDMRDETYFFEYKGETYPVNVTVYCWEREHNKAVRLSDGTIMFDSDSSALWELVIRLIADGVVKRNYDYLFGSDTSMNHMPSIYELNATCDPKVYSSNLHPDDPERVRVEGRVTEPVRGPEPVKRTEPEPRVTFRRLTDEEIEQMSREAAAETTHPKTGWTKAEVMDVARGAGVPEEQLAILSKMRLDEIRSTCLIYDGTDITGNEYNSMQQRHTRFYRLDIEYIKSFGTGS